MRRRVFFKGLRGLGLLLSLASGFSLSAQNVQLYRCASNLDTSFSRVDTLSTMLRKYRGFVTAVLTPSLENPWTMVINQNRFALKRLKDHWMLHVYTSDFALDQVTFVYPYPVLSSPISSVQNSMLLPINSSANYVVSSINASYYLNKSLFLVVDSDLTNPKIYMVHGADENQSTGEVRGTRTAGLIKENDSTFIALMGATRFITDLNYNPSEFFSWSIMKFVAKGTDSFPVLCQFLFAFDTTTNVFNSFDRASFYHLTGKDSLWIASGMYDAYTTSGVVLVLGNITDCSWTKQLQLKDSIYKIVYVGQAVIINDSIAVVGFVLNDTIRFTTREFPAFAVINYQTDRLLAAYRIDYDTAKRGRGVASHAYRISDTLALVNISYPEGFILVNHRGQVIGSYSLFVERIWGGPTLKRTAGNYPTWDDEQIRWIDFVEVRKNVVFGDMVFISANYYQDTLYNTNDPNYNRIYEEQGAFVSWNIALNSVFNGYLTDSCCAVTKWTPTIQKLNMALSSNTPIVKNQGIPLKILRNTTVSTEKTLSGFLHEQECYVTFIVVSTPTTEASEVYVEFLPDRIVIRDCYDCKSIEIIDIYGRILAEFDNYNNVIYINDLPAGIYVLRINNEGKWLSYKFVVHR